MRYLAEFQGILQTGVGLHKRQCDCFVIDQRLSVKRDLKGIIVRQRYRRDGEKIYAIVPSQHGQRSI
jgi:hypothetical protein